MQSQFVNRVWQFTVCCIVFGVLLSGHCFAERVVHPRNRMLVQKGLVPAAILKYFPEVPKITPYEALALYRSGKAVFIGIGDDVPRLQYGWLLIDYMHFNPKKLKLYGIPSRGKFIIVYCG